MSLFHPESVGSADVFLKSENESNPTALRLAAIPRCGMALRNISFNFGKQPADTFLTDQHPDLRADYAMANPPFNMSEWWDGKLEGALSRQLFLGRCKPSLLN